MQATEFIQAIQELIDKHGDLPVYAMDDTAATVEFNDDVPTDKCFIVS